MTLKPPHETFARTEADLTAIWRDMMGPGGFGTRSIWHIFFAADGRLAPPIVPIDDVPPEPDEQFLANLGTIMRESICGWPVTSLAVLLSRPGPATITPSDCRWATALRSTFGPVLCPWPVHLATRNQVRAFTPDDLVAA
jgi:hypothetical protein